MKSWLGFLIVICLLVVAAGAFVSISGEQRLRVEYHNRCMESQNGSNIPASKRIEVCECTSTWFVENMEGKEFEMGIWFAGGMTLNQLIYNHYGQERESRDFKVCLNKVEGNPFRL